MQRNARSWKEKQEESKKLILKSICEKAKQYAKKYGMKYCYKYGKKYGEHGKKAKNIPIHMKIETKWRQVKKMILSL